MYFKIIWPENQLLSEREIASWFQDAVANKMLDPFGPDEGNDIKDMARLLHESGLITLAEPATIQKG